MAEITLKGNATHTSGYPPSPGSEAPDFTLVGTDMDEKSLSDFRGKKVVLNIFPSVDTPVCANSVRKFNEEASARDDTVVLCISADLPFAQSRFCGAEGLDKVVPLSVFRDTEFGDVYGMRIVDGPLAGLLGRAVVVIDEGGTVLFTELVLEIGDEPNYHAALQLL